MRLNGEIKYYKEEGILKSEAIENLEKIVDELMRKNQIQRTNMEGYINESESASLENAIIMRKNLA